MTIPHAKRVRSPGAMVAALRADPHAPYAAMIEVADRCNEACIHCYQVHGSRREMSTEQIEQVMDQLAALGVLFLTISGGEPTLRPDFLQLVEHARSLRFAVKIFSNGLRIDAEMARALSELAVQSVELSLYSHRPEVHDRITRVPGSFERTVSAARWLIAEGVHVVLKAPLMKPNASDYEAYIDWVEALGADYVLDPHLDPREDGSLEPTALRVDDRSYVRLRSDARLVEPSEPTPAPRAPELERSVCGACSGFVHVEADGELRPCTQLQIPVGHALREGIQKAHESNEDALLIRNLRWMDLHGCRDCDLQPYCSRCHANALHEGGDALGPYSQACRQALLRYEVEHGSAPRLSTLESPQPATPRGPFRFEEDGSLRSIPDRLLDSDRDRRAGHPWIHPGPALVPLRVSRQSPPGSGVAPKRDRGEDEAASGEVSPGQAP